MIVCAVVAVLLVPVIRLHYENTLRKSYYDANVLKVTIALRHSNALQYSPLQTL
jgi:hypothetical protein